MTREEAIRFWQIRYENAKDFSDPRWEAQERREHREYVEALRIAVKALSDKQEWTPVSERLPNESDEYLVCPSDGVLEDYSDFGEVMIMPYDADCEAFGWWVDQFDPVSLGFVDSDFNSYEVVAWMPLPYAYKKT